MNAQLVCLLMQHKLLAACLLMAAYPIISVNGNFAALCSTNIVKLSRLIPANTEVNLFHRSPERERLIKQELENLGAEKVLGSFRMSPLLSLG